MRPNFFIVGAAKAGSTSLYNYLKQHPDIFLSEPKELNYFSRDTLLSSDIYYDLDLVEDDEEYERYFDRAVRESVVGEASVSYLSSPEAARKIHTYNPNARILITLREPVARAFSHYLMDYRLGRTDAGFEDIVRGGEEGPLACYRKQYIDLGFYAYQVQRYLDIFGESQTRVILQEDLTNDPASVLRDICEFLGVSPDFMPDLTVRHNEFSMPRLAILRYLYRITALRKLVVRLLPKPLLEPSRKLLLSKRSRPELDPDFAESLKALFSADIDHLEKLIGIDLGAWK